MGRPDPSAGRLALAPSSPPVRGPNGRPAGRGPTRQSPPPPPSFGRRRLLAVAILVTIAAVVYFAATSLGGGGGGGGAGGDAYSRANRTIATEAQSILQVGTDLRTLRDIGKFRRSVEASVASIGTQVAALNHLVAGQSGPARTIVRDTITSGEQIAQLGTAFERDVTKGDLGAANRDEASIRAQIVNLEQQSAAWQKRS